MSFTYLIDGYNLIHALGLVRKTIGSKELETSRRRLLEFLHERLEPVAGAITVVFDAKRRPRNLPAEHWDGRILVRFAGRNEEADDLIETLLGQHSSPRRLVVVSEDRRLRDAAKRRRAQCWGCQELLEQLENLAIAPKPKPIAAAAEAPMSREEVAHWLREFPGLELPNEFQVFLDPPTPKE